MEEAQGLVSIKPLHQKRNPLPEYRSFNFLCLQRINNPLFLLFNPDAKGKAASATVRRLSPKRIFNE